MSRVNRAFQTISRRMQTSNPRQYLLRMAIGSGLSLGAEMLSRRYMGQEFQEPQADVFKEQNDRLRSRISADPYAAGVAGSISGFNPGQWELPRPSPKAKAVVKYALNTDSETFKEDIASFGKEVFSQEIQRLKEAPSKVIESGKRVYSAISGVRQGDPEVLADTAKHLVANRGVEMVSQLGLNLMLSGPAQLIPGPIGAVARGATMAKLVGNAGRKINQAQQDLDQLNGPMMNVIKKRNAKSTVAGQ